MEENSRLKLCQLELELWVRESAMSAKIAAIGGAFYQPQAPIFILSISPRLACSRDYLMGDMSDVKGKVYKNHARDTRSLRRPAFVGFTHQHQRP